MQVCKKRGTIKKKWQGRRRGRIRTPGCGNSDLFITSSGRKAPLSCRRPQTPALAGMSSTPLLCLVLSLSLWRSPVYSCFPRHLVLLTFSLPGFPLMFQTEPPNPIQKAPSPVLVGTVNSKRQPGPAVAQPLSQLAPPPRIPFFARGLVTFSGLEEQFV